MDPTHVYRTHHKNAYSKNEMRDFKSCAEHEEQNEMCVVFQFDRYIYEAKI